MDLATSSLLTLIAAMAAVTYLTRVPLYFLAQRGEDAPSFATHVLARIPTAAFAAIVFPGVLQPSGAIDLDPSSNLYLYAIAITLIPALVLRRNLLVTIVVGVAAATLLHQFAG